jgi:hypothetical protein
VNLISNLFPALFLFFYNFPSYFTLLSCAEGDLEGTPLWIPKRSQKGVEEEEKEKASPAICTVSHSSFVNACPN